MAGNVYKILIVDDDEFLLDIYTTKMRKEGHEVYTAHSGEDALSVLADHSDIDAILLDIVMPAMSGLDLLKQIRAQHLLNDAAVIVLSNQGQESDIENAKAYDIDGYIVKASTTPSEVFEEVIEITAKKRHGVQKGA